MSILHSITFGVAGVSKTRKGKCAVCGKRMQQTRRFEQSINPYNKNAYGDPKSRWEIIDEEKDNANAWVEPLIHDQCKEVMR